MSARQKGGTRSVYSLGNYLDALRSRHSRFVEKDTLAPSKKHLPPHTQQYVLLDTYLRLVCGIALVELQFYVVALFHPWHNALADVLDVEVKEGPAFAVVQQCLHEISPK